MSVEIRVAIYVVFAIISAVAAVFTFRRANRLKAAGDKENYEDQSLAGCALGFLALMLVIVATNMPSVPAG